LILLGAGGMEEVYRSKDTKLDREVASPRNRSTLFSTGSMN